MVDYSILSIENYVEIELRVQNYIDLCILNFHVTLLVTPDKRTYTNYAEDIINDNIKILNK